MLYHGLSRDYQEAVLSILLLPNGDLVSGSRTQTDARIKDWDVKSGKVIHVTAMRRYNGAQSLLLLPTDELVIGEFSKKLKYGTFRPDKTPKI